MIVKCKCDICNKTVATLGIEIPEGWMAIPEGWLRLEFKTKDEGSVKSYSMLLCDGCRIPTERDLDVIESDYKEPRGSAE